MKLTSSAALVVLLVLVGCGGEESTFAEDYNQAVRPVAQFGRTVDGGPEGYDRLATRVRTASRNLAHLSAVPDEARDELARVSLALRRVAAKLEAVARAQRARDPKRQREAATSLARTNREFKRADEALQRAVAG
jgi:ABC-type transporter Mla subunit MlaD